MIYLKPEIEILEFEKTDVITNSPGGGTDVTPIVPGGETGGDDNGVSWG